MPVNGYLTAEPAGSLRRSRAVERRSRGLTAYFVVTDPDSCLIKTSVIRYNNKSVLSALSDLSGE
jgi:hypothetical protein